MLVMAAAVAALAMLAGRVARTKHREGHSS